MILMHFPLHRTFMMWSLRPQPAFLRVHGHTEKRGFLNKTEFLLEKKNADKGRGEAAGSMCPPFIIFGTKRK